MSRAEPALFRRCPWARAAIPWVPLGDLPTPVHRLDCLQERVAPALLWVKRDDLSSPLYGGNKVRALEFLLADALARRAEALLVAGAIGSHFVSAAALFARQAGLRVEALLWHQPWSGRCAEALRLLAYLGVPVRYHPRPAAALAALLLTSWRRRAQGHRVALFPPGGSSPRGTLGAANAALELAEQIAADGLEPPDSLWVACGSGGSAAGLALGGALAGLPTRVRAVRVTPRIACNRAWLAGLADGARRLLEQAERGAKSNTGAGAVRSPVSGLPSPAPLELIHGYHGAGYGVPTPAAEAAAALLRARGLPADTTYTGRAMAALLDHAPREGGRHLFWHTLTAAGRSVPDEVTLDALPAPLRRLMQRQG